MVSFYTSLQECPAKVVVPEFEPSSKKRKWEDPPCEEHLFFREHSNSNSNEEDYRRKPTTFNIELNNLDTPLPSEWQQCLDIQSGEIHFFNTRTYVRTSRDPRRSTASPETSSTTPAVDTSLDIDLELNLTCESLRENLYASPSHVSMKKQDFSYRQTGVQEDDNHVSSARNVDDKRLGLITRCPSWLTLESEHQEMVATVCIRCHMLVMLCKSSPACPNCKFMHPLDQNAQTLTKNKRLCSLLC